MRTSACGHEHEAVLLGDGGVDGLELVGPEVRVPKVVQVGCAQVLRPLEAALPPGVRAPVSLLAIHHLQDAALSLQPIVVSLLMGLSFRALESG